MRSNVKRKLLLTAATSGGILTLLGYPAIKSAYPLKCAPPASGDEQYVDLPSATADLTKDILVPEGIGTGTDLPIDISHWLLLSKLKSTNASRRNRALTELARHRRWNDAEALEIAQALDQQDVVKLARTRDADLRLFLKPPSVEFIEASLKSNKVEKLVKTILKDVVDKIDETCSSCTSFYTNLSIRFRPDSNVLAMNDFNQIDNMMHVESRKRKKSAYNEDVIRLKAVLNNILCGEQQALTMVQSGILVALLYFRHKYKNDLQINGLLSQIIASLTQNPVTRSYVYTNGWMQALVEYSRSEFLELSMPAFKALANLDQDVEEVYGNHIYLLAPVYREQKKPIYDVIFVHGLVGSVFKSWRQGSIALDEYGNRSTSKNFIPTTELLPTESSLFDDTRASAPESARDLLKSHSRCWPKDWLANDLPGLRILAVDYPTALSNWRTDCDLNKDSLRQRALHVMKELKDAKVGERPIIWVAHSMGGLLVKQILVMSDELSRLSDLEESSRIVDKDCDIKDNSDDKHEFFLPKFNLDSENIETMSRKFMDNLAKQTKGIIFYSVPHKGSNLDWIERKNLQRLLMLTTEVIELQKGSPLLLDLHDKFLKFIKKPEIHIRFLTFAENAISSFGVNKVVQWKGVLVHEDSLKFDFGPTYTLNIDHAHTCKPHSKESITYKKSLEFISDLVPTEMKLDEDILPFISFVM